jgi:hypothetical protein
MRRTTTTLWAAGSCTDIRFEIDSMEQSNIWGVRQIALHPSEDRPQGCEPMFDGFIVYEMGDPHGY